ncbi:MAG: hypothetical protein ACQET8_13495 [Bacillota bacterium]
MNKTLLRFFTATTLAFTAVAATGTTGVLAAKKEQKPDLDLVDVVYQGHALSTEGVNLVKGNLIIPVESLVNANGGTVIIDRLENKLTVSRGDLSYSMRIHPRFFQFDNAGTLVAIIPAKVYAGNQINSLKQQVERKLGVELQFNEEENTLYIN